ncbi:zinc-finger protein [Pseudogymnoascus verrucosus]|uniref:Zinc-finger protein n=1 Tax=Pseudogymnoascus verrucosus TaxID=342668 RepID=A0A1B8GHQ2_9PEZI|nr:zinc-finger protein [Pseudogymnoascus verrucosus]OBT95371.1 zinc-finger protein [Pseudogymnoascus verrucosus]
MGATPFQALLGQLEIMNDNRAYNPSSGGNMDMMFSQDGSIDAADVWANALPWDSSSNAYTQATNTEAPSPHPTTEDSFHQSHHDHYFGSGHSSRSTIIYEEKCDSPECHVQECHEPDCAEDLVECTDPYCLPIDACPDPDVCHSGSTKCAGSLEMDIVSAAASLAAMKPPTMSNGQFYNGPQNYDFCATIANGYTSATHPPHFGACMFTNAYMPSYNNGGMMGAAQDSGMCQYINNNSNFCQSHETYHNMGPPSFQNSTLQYAMSLRDLSSRSSSSQDPFAFSTEPTPSSASTYSSPHPPSDVALLTPASQPDPNFPVPVCQWHDTPTSTPCSKTFATKAALQSHIQSVHTAPLSKSLGFVCRWSGCSRLSLPADRAGFAQRSKLDRHMQSHTGHKACKCPECHHEFSTSQTLESHMRTHTGDKPFKCKEPGCDYEAAQASQLTMHTRTKHTREKPLLCDFPGCGRRFAESSNLSKHKKIHEPEEECRCGVCGKSFRRRDQLRRHLKIHVRKDGLSEVGARKALGGKRGEEMSETGSQLLSPSPSVPPGGAGMEMEFNEEARMGMDMEIDGGSMMASQQSMTAQSNWAMT